MVIKWIHRLVTLLLLVLVTALLWLNYPPDTRESDELQRTYKLSDNVWLYMTVNSSGGATVSTRYRYYLSKEIPGKEREIIKQLNTMTPFLEGTGSITDAHVEKDGEVNIAYSGQVFSLRDTVSDLRFTVTP
ncbi:hypothetical protein [Lelliottia sp. CFBP8978]|uniref:hypothetical protein n=1 Tax=Lelliottia sp. CFBP8978 TaxID=3096522 RepID=UPI002A6B8EBD|nr:hypothetical protein [Lelliottia sp. CFBP8978]MDY1038154.1 hypothetical protein [Lelliottia sp. CFBP8978]